MLEIYDVGLYYFVYGNPIDVCRHILYLSTVKPRSTVTKLVRSPHHYDHPCSFPNCIPQYCNKVTSPLRSHLASPMGGRNSQVPM